MEAARVFTERSVPRHMMEYEDEFVEASMPPHPTTNHPRAAQVGGRRVLT